MSHTQLRPNQVQLRNIPRAWFMSPRRLRTRPSYLRLPNGGDCRTSLSPAPSRARGRYGPARISRSAASIRRRSSAASRSFPARSSQLVMRGNRQRMRQRACGFRPLRRSSNIKRKVRLNHFQSQLAPVLVTLGCQSIARDRCDEVVQRDGFFVAGDQRKAIEAQCGNRAQLRTKAWMTAARVASERLVPGIPAATLRAQDKPQLSAAPAHPDFPPRARGRRVPRSWPASRDTRRTSGRIAAVSPVLFKTSQIVAARDAGLIDQALPPARARAEDFPKHVQLSRRLGLRHGERAFRQKFSRFSHSITRRQKERATPCHLESRLVISTCP